MDSVLAAKSNSEEAEPMDVVQQDGGNKTKKGKKKSREAKRLLTGE